MNGWSCSPKHGPGHFTVLKTLYIWMVESFSITFELMAGPCFPKHGPVHFTVLKKIFVGMLCSHEKNIQVYGWAALPNIPCHGPTHFGALKNRFVLMLCRFSTTFKWTAGRAAPKTVQGVSRCWRLYLSGWYEAFQKHSNLWLGRVPTNTASFVHGVEKPFRLDVMQPCKNIQVYGWAAFPNKPCHGPAQFAALKNHFVLMQCRHLTTFKWTDGPVPSNTVPFIPRWWKTFTSGWCEAFQKHSNLWLGCAPPNTAQFYLRCWRIYW